MNAQDSTSRALPPMIDTHIHLNFDAYDEDRDAVIARAAAAGVARCINPGVDLETSRAGIDLAAAYPGVIYAAVGYHPNSTAGFARAWLEPIRALASSPGVVSIGEIGLDYYWDKSPKPDQFAAFEAQLELAAELNLPVIIHNREASEDVIRILESWAGELSGTLREAPGVLHSVSAPAELVERALAAGFYIGFTGPITYKNADQTRRIAAAAPLERILVETDGPFLTPVPHRGKRNEPAYIPLIVERLASVRQLPLAQIAEATTVNAERLFRFT
ncbi:MAG: putative DNase [Chloroflexi bacterium OLB13]|nr:MAG: putative DNase [Chloroflexi bacterium OLB13]